MRIFDSLFIRDCLKFADMIVYKTGAIGLHVKNSQQELHALEKSLYIGDNRACTCQRLDTLQLIFPLLKCYKGTLDLYNATFFALE